MMDATLIVIDNNAELARALKSLESMMGSDDPATNTRAAAQARLIAAYEESNWPRRMPRTADVIRYLMEQHGLARADMVPLLGTISRVSEVLSGKKGLSMTMVQRLRARFGVPADVLLPPPVARGRAPSGAKRRAA
jgi:HTH-type transcriptional regulator/antitoxin HigA